MKPNIAVDIKEFMLIYVQGGKEALVNKYCVFPEYPKVNSTLEEIIDIVDMTMRGEMEMSKFLDGMETLNAKLMEEMEDIALDAYNEGVVEKEVVEGCLDYLNKSRNTSEKLIKQIREL